MGDNDDNWHYTFGLEENSGWIGHNGQIPGYFTFEVYNPELNATTVIAMNSYKKGLPLSLFLRLQETLVL